MSVKRWLCRWEEMQLVGAPLPRKGTIEPTDGEEVYVLATDYDALQAEVERLHAALDEIIALGTSPVARDNGPNYLANRMYHIADKARGYPK